MKNCRSLSGVLEAANQVKNNAVEVENHVKHGASSKSLTSIKTMNMKSSVKKIVVSFMLFSLHLLVISAQGGIGNISCTLRGEVIDRPQSNQLMLIKEGSDPRSTEWISISIENGKFEYILNCDHEEFYELIFYEEFMNGHWLPITFISEQGTLNFTLFPSEESEHYQLEGGALNKAYKDFENDERNRFFPLAEQYWEKFEQLRNDDNYYSSEFLSLEAQSRASTDDAERRVLSEQHFKMQMEGLHLTPDARKVWTSYDSVSWSVFKDRLEFAKNNVDILGYSILFSSIRELSRNAPRFFKMDIMPFWDVYNTIFATKFPEHPYTENLANLATASSLRAGVQFVDFTAVDMAGNQVRLSERIKGKPTLLHLWASWCGPCRRKGINLIPVYEEFRDKGFVVIGVARERGNTDAAQAAIKMDGYTWENLVELNDTEQIWQKYGLGNAGGGEFLIDENGIIIAVNPSIEEIRSFMGK